MSRSNPGVSTTPVNKYFAWAGGSGALQHYDKEAKERVNVPLPFSFMVLDELTSIGGFSDSDKSGIWSNEVRSVKDHLIVKTSAGTINAGTYEQIKDQLKAQGGKYARSLYIAYQEPDGEDGKWVIGNIKLVGSGLGSWFEFRKANPNVHEIGVRITGTTEEKKGATTYYMPTFEAVEVGEADNAQAIELDRELQKYLKTYFNNRAESDVVVEEAEDDLLDDQKPIDLSEIPF